MRFSASGKSLDEIKLRDLTVHCTIGIYPEEKLRTQVLHLNISLFLDTRAAADTGSLTKTVDYAQLAKQLAFILQHARFRLLESAAAALSRFILNAGDSEGALAQVEMIDIEIIKPEALRDLAIPSVRIVRSKEEFATLSREARQVLFNVPEASVERWLLKAGESLRYESAEATFLLPEGPGLMIDGTAIHGPIPLTKALVLQNSLSTDLNLLVVTTRDMRAVHRRRTEANLQGGAAAFGEIQDGP